MDFAQPQLLFWLLLLPAAAAVAAWCRHRGRLSLGAWAARGLWPRLLAGGGDGRQWLALGLLALTLAASVLALARPRWGTVRETVEHRALDVVFVLDSSLSMACRDVKPDRLTAAKAVVRRLLGELPDASFSLVQVEGDGYHLTPLTRDAALVELLLDTVEPGSLPTPGTALAPALARAVEAFPQSQLPPSSVGAGAGEDLDTLAASTAGRRVVVLLSDGEDHRGGLDGALARVQAAGVRVHALGVGTRLGAPVPTRESLAAEATADLEEYKLDGEGREILSRLEAEPLERLAAATGGLYLAVDRVGVDLAPLVERLEAAGGEVGEEEVVERRAERFQWPLALAVLALGLYLAGPPGFGAGLRRLPVGLVGVALLLLAAQEPQGPGAAVPAGEAETISPRDLAGETAGDRWLYNARERTSAARRAVVEGDPESAAAAAGTALGLRPRDARLWFNAGTTAQAAGRPGAAAALEQAARLAEAGGDTGLTADSYYNLGNVHLDGRRWQAAIDAYRQALRARPEHEDAKFNLEWALRQLDEAPQPESDAGEGPEPPPEGGGGAPPEQGPGQNPPPSPGESPDGQETPAGASPPQGGSPQDAALPPQQAEAILSAVENLEREQRREQQKARAAAADPAAAPGLKDW